MFTTLRVCFVLKGLFKFFDVSTKQNLTIINTLTIIATLLNNNGFYECPLPCQCYLHKKRKIKKISVQLDNKF